MYAALRGGQRAFNMAAYWPISVSAVLRVSPLLLSRPQLAKACPATRWLSVLRCGESQPNLRRNVKSRLRRSEQQQVWTRNKHSTARTRTLRGVHGQAYIQPRYQQQAALHRITSHHLTSPHHSTTSHALTTHTRPCLSRRLTVLSPYLVYALCATAPHSAALASPLRGCCDPLSPAKAAHRIDSALSRTAATATVFHSALASSS